MRLHVRTALIGMPAASGAAGYSPTPRNHRPHGVRYRTYHTTNTRNAATQLSKECPENSDTRVRPIPGIAPRKLRSTAGMAFDTRLIDVPLSPPVASANANTVPPEARMLMAK